MKSSRRWMMLALGLTLVAGASVGVVADRLVLGDQPETAKDIEHARGVIWFPCGPEQEGVLHAGAEPRSEPPQVGEDAEPERVEGRAQNRREQWRERRMESLQAELQLDSAQVEELRGVFRRHGRAAHGFWQETRDEYCGMRERMREDARALLRPEQRPLFEARLRRLDEKAAADANRSHDKSRPEPGQAEQKVSPESGGQR